MSEEKKVQAFVCSLLNLVLTSLIYFHYHCILLYYYHLFILVVPQNSF